MLQRRNKHRGGALRRKREMTRHRFHQRRNGLRSEIDCLLLCYASKWLDPAQTGLLCGHENQIRTPVALCQGNADKLCFSCKRWTSSRRKGKALGWHASTRRRGKRKKYKSMTHRFTTLTTKTSVPKKCYRHDVPLYLLESTLYQDPHDFDDQTRVGRGGGSCLSCWTIDPSGGEKQDLDPMHGTFDKDPYPINTKVRLTPG